MLTSTNIRIPPAPGDPRLLSVINAIVEDLVRGKHVAAHTEALKAYGALAVPGLLLHLYSTDAVRRSVAFYGLQNCWSPAARKPVAELLKESDPLTRHMAALVYAKHEGLSALAKVCEPLLDDPRPAIAGSAFERVEGEGPDLARMLRFMRKPGMWDYTWKYLPRYYDPALTAPALKMLGGASLEAGLAAAVALIHQHKRSATIRQGLAQLLGHSAAEIREMSAEYLMWHGSTAESAALSKALEQETDLYAKAAMEAALTAIARREKHVPGASTLGTKYLSRSVVLPSTPNQPLQKRYLSALHMLGPLAAPLDWKSAFELYRTAEPFEPHWAYKGDDPPQEFAETRVARLKLQARLFAIPAPDFNTSVPEQERPVEAYRGEFCAAGWADAFVPPLRGYADPLRESYGKEMEEEAEGFGGMVHVADDVGWHRDHLTVVAAGNGLVRQVRCASSWGCMLVLEHKLPDGKFVCSLYAHLSPFICVSPGDAVKKGQKIGGVGRSFTWENGGYIAHLHFGIHEGPFWQTYEAGAPLDVRYQGKSYTGKVLHADLNFALVDIHTPTGAKLVRRSASWICGYVSKECWEEERHGWVDPQEFLKEHEHG